MERDNKMNPQLQAAADKIDNTNPITKPVNPLTVVPKAPVTDIKALIAEAQKQQAATLALNAQITAYRKEREEKVAENLEFLRKTFIQHVKDLSLDDPEYLPIVLRIMANPDGEISASISKGYTPATRGGSTSVVTPGPRQSSPRGSLRVNYNGVTYPTARNLADELGLVSLAMAQTSFSAVRLLQANNIAFEHVA